MDAQSFVYKEVYKGCLDKGCGERDSHQAAVIALDNYKKNRFTGRVSKLIEDAIKKAKRLSK